MFNSLKDIYKTITDSAPVKNGLLSTRSKVVEEVIMVEHTLNCDIKSLTNESPLKIEIFQGESPSLNYDSRIEDFLLFEEKNNELFLKCLDCDIPLENYTVKVILPKLNCLIHDGKNFLNCQVTVEKYVENKSSGSLEIHCFEGTEIVSNGKGKTKIEHVSNIQAIYLSARSSLDIEQINSSQLLIKSISSGHCNILTGTIEQLTLDCRGKTKINIEANVRDVKIEAQKADIKFENIENILDANLNEDSSLFVKGDCLQHIQLTSKTEKDIEIRGIKTNILNIRLEDKGNIRLMGEAHQFDIFSSGLGSFKGLEFEANHSKVELVSRGNINYNPTQTVEAINKGTGYIELLGKATLERAQVKNYQHGKINLNKVKVKVPEMNESQP